jgi:hypothetical protein
MQHRPRRLPAPRPRHRLPKALQPEPIQVRIPASFPVTLPFFALPLRSLPSSVGTDTDLPGAAPDLSPPTNHSTSELMRLAAWPRAGHGASPADGGCALHPKGNTQRRMRERPTKLRRRARPRGRAGSWGGGTPCPRRRASRMAPARAASICPAVATMRLIDAITVGCTVSCSAVEVGSYGASREGKSRVRERERDDFAQRALLLVERHLHLAMNTSASSNLFTGRREPTVRSIQ